MRHSLNVVYWFCVGVGHHKYSGLGQSGPPQSASYGFPGPSKKIEIPNGRVGVIIGKGGETIKYLQLQSGAKIQVTRDMDADPNSTTRGVEITGTSDQIAKAEQLINDVLAEVLHTITGYSINFLYVAYCYFLFIIRMPVINMHLY